MLFDQAREHINRSYGTSQKRVGSPKISNYSKRQGLWKGKEYLQKESMEPDYGARMRARSELEVPFKERKKERKSPPSVWIFRQKFSTKRKTLCKSLPLSLSISCAAALFLSLDRDSPPSPSLRVQTHTMEEALRSRVPLAERYPHRSRNALNPFGFLFSAFCCFGPAMMGPLYCRGSVPIAAATL